MPAASSATFGARRVEARASPPRGPRAPETRQRDLSRRVSSPSPHRRRGASRPALGEPKSATLASLPAHFDLDTAILLAGFAFEAYASPEGGTRDEDTRGGATAYVGDFARDVFAGVLEVRVRSARGLPRADALGASDPYVVLSVGGGDDGYGPGRPKSSARTSTKKNTLNPKWGDDDGRCVMCARRDPRAQTLTLDVYDEDRLPGKKDDFLGTVTVCFADLVEDAIASTPSGAGSALGGFAAAIGKMPGFQSRRRECLGVALQGGPGGGTVDFSLTFTPLSAPAREVASAGLKRTAALLREAEKNVANVAERRTKTNPPAGTKKNAAGTKKNAAFAARAASVVAREAARRLDAIEAESVREQNESSSWAMRARNDWSVLATERENGENGDNGAARRKKNKNANPGSPSRSPERFSKACFVENSRTDTQCAVWRSRRDRTVVVAFRGTEMDRPLDFFTDVNFKPAPFEALAEPPRGEETHSAEAAAAEVRAPRVHGGFLRAYESVRARVFAAVDDVIAAETHEDAEDDHDGSRDDTWHVFVTGHSLGGALATLFACELSRRSASGSRAVGRDPLAVTMYNFGSPRVGDGVFCDAYNALVPDSVRVVNRADLVPTLPALLGYRHVERGVRVSVGADGAADIAPESYSTKKSYAAARYGTDRYLREDGENGFSDGSGAQASEASAASRNIVRLAERLGVVGSLGVDAETAADAAEALSSLASLDALADHFEDEYLVALRAARKT